MISEFNRVKNSLAHCVSKGYFMKKSLAQTFKILLISVVIGKNHWLFTNAVIN